MCTALVYICEWEDWQSDDAVKKMNKGEKAKCDSTQQTAATSREKSLIIRRKYDSSSKTKDIQRGATTAYESQTLTRRKGAGQLSRLHFPRSPKPVVGWAIGAISSDTLTRYARVQELQSTTAPCLPVCESVRSSGHVYSQCQKCAMMAAGAG